MPKIGELIKARELGYIGAGYYVWWDCVDCGKAKWIRHAKREMKDFRCRSCSQKKGLNPNWKGGIVKNNFGYKTYRIPEGHKFYCMKNSNDVVLLHRLIMAEYLGRPLKEKEIVHHINGNIKDNRIENLMLLSWVGEHTKLHHKLGTWKKNRLSMLEEIIDKLGE